MDAKLTAVGAAIRPCNESAALALANELNQAAHQTANCTEESAQNLHYFPTFGSIDLSERRKMCGMLIFKLRSELRRRGVLLFFPVAASYG